MKPYFAHIFLLLLAILLPALSSAQSTWNGGSGVDSNWTSGANWGGAAPVAGNALLFGGTTRLTPINDFAADTLFNGITFNSGAGAFTLSGNRITLGGNIVNNDDTDQTFNLNMVLNGTRTFSGVNNGTGMAVNGVISEMGGSQGIVVNMNGALSLNNSNTFTGGVEIQKGSVYIGNSGALNSAAPNAVNFTNSGGSSAGLILFGRSIEISGLNSTSTLATVQNGFVGGAPQATLTVRNAVDSSFAGTFRNGASGAGLFHLIKAGSAVLTLTNPNNITDYGGTTQVTEGTLRSGANNALSANSATTVAADAGKTATLDLNGWSNTLASLTLGGGSGGTSTVQTGAGTLTLGGDVTYSATGNSNGATISGKLALGSSTRNFTIGDSTAAAEDLTVSAVISGASGTVGLTKLGAGTLTLSGNNTFTGTTTVSAGKLALSGAGSIADSSAVNLSASGATLDISAISGTSETVASLAGASGSSVLLGGKTLIAGGGTTFSGGMSGSGGGFTKTGAGTFIVSGASLTQTGTTTVSTGVINLTNSSITGGTLSISSVGTVSVAGSSSLGGTVNNATGGQINLGSGSTLTLQGGGSYTNNGNVRLLSTNGDLVTLAIGGDVTFGGAGTVTMDTSGSSNLRIIGNVGTERLTNSAGHTIQGAGTFGGNAMALTNDGNILSNWGTTLTIDPNGSGAINSATGVMRATSGSTLTFTSGNLTNAGLLETTGGGLSISSAVIANSGGTVQTVGAGIINLTNSSISDGNVNNSSTGVINVSGTNTLGGTVNNAAGGQIRLGSGSTLTLQGGGSYTNNGNVRLLSTNGDLVTLAIGGDVTFGGAGTVTMDASSSINLRIVGTVGTERLTNSAGHTIQGAGTFGGNAMALTNDGNILSNWGTTLTIDPNASGAINSATGVMRAASGSILTFTSGPLANAGLVEALGTVNLTSATMDNTGGTIRAAGGVLNVTSTSVSGGAVEMTGASSLNLNTATISGGTVTNSGTGAIAATAGTTSTISSAVTLSGSNSISASSTRTLNLTGGISKDAVTTTFLGTGAINVSGTGISGASASSNIIVSGAGTALTLSAVNTYGGSTTLTGGNLILSGAGNIPDTSAVNLSGAATLNISGITASGETVGSLAGVSGSSVVLGGKSLTAGGDGTSTSYAGNISGTLGSVAKTGGGTMTLSGTNTYTGTTTVSGGVLRLDSATALPGGIGAGGGTSALSLSGGVIGLGAGDFARAPGTGSAQVQWTGSGGFAAYGADRNVNLGGAAATVTWGGGSFVPLASALILGAADATHTVTLRNGIDFADGTRTIQVDNGAAAIDAILSGTLSNGAFSKTGAGTLKVTGSIATANAVFSAGSIELNNGGTNSALTADTITISGGALILGASEQIKNTSAVVLNSGSLGFSGSGQTETIGTFTNNGGTFSTGANTLIGTGNTITWSTGTNTINDGGLVQDSHWVISGGTNTVNGGASGGVLEVQAPGGVGLVFSGTSSPTITLDSSNSVAGKILLSNDVTVDNTLTSGSAQILSGGALSNPGRIDLNGSTRTFSVNNGSAATDLLISASLQNGGLTKSDTGTLALTGSNTFSGTTTVSGGTLQLGDGAGGATGALTGTTQVAVNTGGTLLLGSSTANQVNDAAAVTLGGGTITLGTSGMNETVGKLTLTGNSVIDFGSLSTARLNFDDSSAISWSSYTLSIYNWTAGTDQLYFGSNNSGLTSTQLNQISFFTGSGTGYVGTGAFNLTPFDGANGEVSAVPEPSSVLVGLSLLCLAGYRERRWLFRCREARGFKTA